MVYFTNSGNDTSKKNLHLACIIFDYRPKHAIKYIKAMVWSHPVKLCGLHFISQKVYTTKSKQTKTNFTQVHCDIKRSEQDTPLPLHSHMIWKGTYTNQILYKMIQFKKSQPEKIFPSYSFFKFQCEGSFQCQSAKKKMFCSE